ncbi:MAG: PQQ-binding-like beta-propeller repeat protein [Gemmatimonadota bacterium]|nr:PQQ-binding-like beta-propeller repeat protein [Gemmatimonadota bacterium]
MIVRTLQTALLVLLTGSWAYGSSDTELRPLVLDAEGAEESFEPERLSLGPGGEVFILDRRQAVLMRIDPENGRRLWQIDGSESGSPFVDPAYISRTDGFFIYLTDRGTRKVWRIDYRGELRGTLDLPFATDPVLLELVAGRQLAVYDRAASRVFLLDDSGRLLWDFAPGGGRRSGEPLDIAVSMDGKQMYLLWPGGGQITAVDIFGRTASDLSLELKDFTPRRIETVPATRGRQWLCLTDRDDRLVLIESTTRAVRELKGPGLTRVWDIVSAGRSALGKIFALDGSPPRLVEIDLEKGK